MIGFTQVVRTLDFIHALKSSFLAQKSSDHRALEWEFHFTLKVQNGSATIRALNAWHFASPYTPWYPKQHNKVGGKKHGERRGGKKTPLGNLVVGRPGGSVPRGDVGAGRRRRQPGACPPAGASSGLANAVRAPAAVATEAAGVGEAVVQHLRRPDTQHFILVGVESACKHLSCSISGL